MTIEPITVKAAMRLAKQWHRHLKRGNDAGLFAAALADNGSICAVAVAINPARVWQGTGRFVIGRVSVAPEVDPRDNACSRLYGALCRAGSALGYREAWTYTLPEEPGTSLRAAGFADMGLTSGGEHSRASRPRRPAERSEPKRRWVRMLGRGLRP